MCAIRLSLPRTIDRRHVLCEQESVHYFKYKQGENVLYEYADDIAPRHLTATLPLDYDTVAAADKFGNIFVTRLPPDVSSQASQCCSTPLLLTQASIGATSRECLLMITFTAATSVWDLSACSLTPGCVACCRLRKTQQVGSLHAQRAS